MTPHFMVWMVIGLILLVGTNHISTCSTIKVQHGTELLYGHNLNNNGTDIPGLVFINKRGVFKTGRSWSELINKDQRYPSSVSWISRYGSVSFNTFGKDFRMEECISGKITNAKGFVHNTPIEQIGFSGNRLSFCFKSREEGLFIFAKGVFEQNEMGLTLNGLETEYGTFELIHRGEGV